MDNPTDAVFDAIKEAAQAAIDKASALPDTELRKLGAVNWGDIGVGDVVFCRNSRGETWFTVEIEEASPECGLGPFVAEQIAGLFPEIMVCVRTEW